MLAGHTNAAIGAQLCISARTVETHRTHAMRSWAAHPVELALYAVRRGIVPQEQ
ncbi:MAG: LuxR C-terminal-related transcriptional regulator [Actinobacteria bacterium]|nr:LuxR C-terminal-related transcriptional regulator [Actinomycetota bacterium]